MRRISIVLAAVMAFALLLAACGTTAGENGQPAEGTGAKTTASADAATADDLDGLYQVDSASEEMILDEAVPESSAPPVSTLLMPEASGTMTYGNRTVTIDASHTADGYVMIQYAAQANVKIKVLINGPSGERYTYNLDADGQYVTYSLSDGSGNYTIGVYKQNPATGKYATQYSKTLAVTLTDEFAPFLRPNQYVNYTESSACVPLAAQLTADRTGELDKIQAIYNYVVKNLRYDYNRARTVRSGYLPDLDQVLAEKKGICFDYASLMTAMCRSQGIPAKLVVGYTGTAYHAWINVYTQANGWVDGVIFFDGSVWKLMDPTFASSGNSSAKVMQYIGNSANYTAKYLY